MLGQPPEQVDVRLPDNPAPYPGLLPFDRAQANRFFGRDEESKQLLQAVRQHSLTMVVGASGSGKSSLVMAGLCPQLDRGWHTLMLAPGSRPLRALADQIATLGAEQGRLRLADELEQRLAQRPDGLATALSTLLAERSEITTLLLIVDQFEELFTQTLGSPEQVRQQQRQFILNLKAAAATLGGRLRIVLTLRADFLGHWLSVPGIPEQPPVVQIQLRALSPEALREAIVRPAQAVGALFEKGLVNRLIEEMADQPTLPLLQFILSQLWQRRHGIWLTHAAYEELGGLSGALDGGPRRSIGSSALISSASPASCSCGWWRWSSTSIMPGGGCSARN